MRARHRVGSSLKELSFGPSYHMSELFGHPEHIEPWEADGWALALSPPQLHHLCVEVSGAPWGSTAVGDFQNRLDSAHGAPWRSNVGFRTELKIMVLPVRIRVPPL